MRILRLSEKFPPVPHHEMVTTPCEIAKKRWQFVSSSHSHHFNSSSKDLKIYLMMMEVYNPQKYCNRCKSPFTKNDPNPKFLSCKHLMCIRCFKTHLEGITIMCPCGIQSSVPVPDHQVFPDLNGSPWKDWLKKRSNRIFPPTPDPKTTAWSGALYDKRLLTDSVFNAPMKTESETPVIYFGGKPGWVDTSRVPSECEAVDTYGDFAPSWLPRSPTLDPTPREEVSPPPDPRVVPDFSGQIKTTSQILTSLSGHLRIIDPKKLTIEEFVAKDDPISPRAQTDQPADEAAQNADSLPVWTQLNKNSIFGRAPSSTNEAQQSPTPKKPSKCPLHLLEYDLWCEGCDKVMCGACALGVDHDSSHFIRHHPSEVFTFSSNRFHDVIQVMNDHSQAAEGFTVLADSFKLDNREALIDFIDDFIKTIERERDCLRDYEYRSAELAASSSAKSIAFDVALDRPSKIFDDYLAVKNSLERMVVDREINKKGAGTDLILKVASMFIYQIFRSSLRGELRAIKRSPQARRVNAATNTCPLSEDSYAVWLGTLNQRAELAKRMTDPTAVIPPGWFINTLPNVFFVEFSIGQRTIGRVLIETNPDVAPVMSANFALLCDKTRPLSYQDCVVFQCWPNESIITGDNETKNGTGGKSVLNDDFMVPDNSGLTSFRGAVGMRRLKKRISKAGEISSQFRITLQEIKGITGIFGRVVKGIEIVEEIARNGDRYGNPKKVIRISDCGKI